MPSGNVTKVLDAVQPSGGGTHTSDVLYLQSVREETMTVWLHASGSITSGSVEIRVAPDAEAEGLTTPPGAVLHTIVLAGTAGSGKTKIDTNGHAVVSLQAFPRVRLHVKGTSGTEIINAWIIE